MKITFDATSALKQAGGIGRLTRGLLLALAQTEGIERHTVTALHTLDSPRRHRPALPPAFAWRTLPLRERQAVWLWHRLKVPLPVELLAGGCDLFHAPDYTLPPLARAKGIVTIHDLSFEALTDVHTPKLRAYLRQAVPASVRRADHIFADSQNTRQELMRYYGVADDKITVVYPGVEPTFRPFDPLDSEAQGRRAAVQAKYAIAYPFFLTVGTIEPRKNISTLIRAFGYYRKQGNPDMRLLIAGGGGWLGERERLTALVGDLALSDYVQFLGFVPDDELPTLVTLATLLAYPSRYEGFGFPVVEAMASGIPAITARNTSLTEVGGDAAYYIDEAENVMALADGLNRVAHDEQLREQMIEKGLRHARNFTWAKTAQQVLSLYEKTSSG